MTGHRSQQWYAGADLRNTYLHRAWMRRGLPEHAFDGRRGLPAGPVRVAIDQPSPGQLDTLRSAIEDLT